MKGRTEEDSEKNYLFNGDNWNKDRESLNNIPFTDWTGADGFKIPLGGIDMNGMITFHINLPAKLASLSFGTPKDYSGQNHWCWLKDISLKIYNKAGEETDKSDVVYGGEDDGVIDENSVNELDEITCKITTFPGKGRLSYSNVGNALSGGFLSAVTETYQSNTPRKPEENLIERYINQYSTQTIKEQLVQDMYCYPFIKYYDEYWQGKQFVWQGAEIDYRDARQTIDITEIK